MASSHLVATNSSRPRRVRRRLVGSRSGPAGLAHLSGMDTATHIDNATFRTQLPLIEQVMSLSELCAHLNITAQTIYDLRSQGRGPSGFRVGRELRFRVSEVEAWLARLEQDDRSRHEPGWRG